MFGKFFTKIKRSNEEFKSALDLMFLKVNKYVLFFITFLLISIVILSFVYPMHQYNIGGSILNDITSYINPYILFGFCFIFVSLTIVWFYKNTGFFFRSVMTVTGFCIIIVINIVWIMSTINIVFDTSPAETVMSYVENKRVRRGKYPSDNLIINYENYLYKTSSTFIHQISVGTPVWLKVKKGLLGHRWLADIHFDIDGQWVRGQSAWHVLFNY
jgi:hypothetical protein